MKSIVAKFKNIYKQIGIWTDEHIGTFKKAFLKFYNYKNVSFVIFLFIVAVIMFGYTLITNSWTIPVAGDFVLQEIPFYFNGYDDWRQAIATGHFPMWDEQGFLGVNNIGANSFYYLFNIFFLPTIIFPRSWIPQIQACLILIKFVLAGYFMKKLLDIFNVKEDTSKMVATAYAFSGWSLFYLWFNHFLEIAVLFPIMLIGIEKTIRDKKPIWLAVSIFLIGITNYFFLISFCFTGVMYALFRYFQLFKNYTKEERIKVLVYGVLAFAIGIMMSCFILLTSLEAVKINTRVTNATYLPNLVNALKEVGKSFRSFKISSIGRSLKSLFKVLFVWDTSYWKKYILYPFSEFFFPTISCHSLFMWNSYDYVEASIYISAPLMLFLVPSFYYSIKKRKVSHLIAFLGILILLITPFAYYCFSGFTQHAYGRWELFVVNCLCIYIATSMDHKDEIPVYTLDISLAITLFAQIALLIHCLKTAGTLGTSAFESERKEGAIAFIIWTTAAYVIMRGQYKKKVLFENVRYMIALETIVICSFFLDYQGTVSYSSLYGGPSSVKQETTLINRIKKEDKSFYRVFSKSANRDSNNLGMVEGYNGIGTFHSIYNYNLNDFISWSRISYTNGTWTMGVHEKRANLDEFLGIKYYILPKDDTNVPFGYSYYAESDDKIVYKNDNHIELGYAFDNIISSTLMSNSEYNSRVLKNEILYLTGAIMNEETYNSLGDVKDEFSYYTDIDTALFNNGGLYQPSIPQSNIHIYKAVWDTVEQGKFDGFLQQSGDIYYNNDNSNYGDDYYPYTIEDATGLKWNSYLEITPPSYARIAPLADSKGGAYVTVKARMGENLNIILYGKDDKILTQDRHMIHHYNKSSDWKYERGFYVNEEVTKVEIRVYDTLSSKAYITKPTITYEYYDSYKARIDKIKENPIENIQKTTDKIKFTTNYDSKKIVVLQVPYDSGWTLKTSNGQSSNVKTNLYSSTGGFLCFVAPEGETSYTLTYQTPGISTGLLITGVGFELFSVLYIYTEIYEENKKRIKETLNLNN